MGGLFGSSGKAARLEDKTPPEFVGLRQPTASTLTGLLGQGGFPSFQGQFNAPLSQNEANVLNLLNQFSLPSIQAGTAREALGAHAGGVFNPFAGSAGITAPELFGLSRIAGLGFDGRDPNASLTLESLLRSGAGSGSVLGGAQGLFGAGAQGAFNPLTATGQLSTIASGAPNPFLQQAIEAAQRPILQDFEQAVLANRGLFSQAGQTIQGDGSSPFQQALARAQTGTAQALGDVGSRIAFGAFDADSNRRLAAAQGLGQLELGARGQGIDAIGLALQSALGSGQLGLGAAQAGSGLSSDALQRALAATGALGLPRTIADTGLTRQAAAFEEGAGRSLQAATAIPGFDRAQFDALQANLEAQALPRLISELGIERGLAEFQRQQGALLSLLQLSGQLASPTIATQPGKAGSSGILGGLLGSFAGGFGGAAGKAAGGAVFG